jgi:hypothetical protein
MNYVHVRGKVARGLVRRRCLEAIAFASPLGDEVIAKVMQAARELHA